MSDICSKTGLMFIGCFGAYVWQLQGHIGWATSTPFASFNPTNPRTNSWNFWKKILRIGKVGKLSFFESAILIFFSKKKKKNVSSPRKLPYAPHHKLLLIRSRSWIKAIHKDRIFWKNLLKNKEIVFGNGVKNIQAASYNGARTVCSLHIICVKVIIYLMIWPLFRF